MPHFDSRVRRSPTPGVSTVCAGCAAGLSGFPPADKQMQLRSPPPAFEHSFWGLSVGRTSALLFSWGRTRPQDPCSVRGAGLDRGRAAAAWGRADPRISGSPTPGFAPRNPARAFDGVPFSGFVEVVASAPSPPMAELGAVGRRLVGSRVNFSTSPHMFWTPSDNCGVPRHFRYFVSRCVSGNFSTFFG